MTEAVTMMEEHSIGLLVAILGTLAVFMFGLIVNLSHLKMQYMSEPLIPEILEEEGPNQWPSHALSVSLAGWSTCVWGVVYVIQFFWLVYALVSICRRTAVGPVYNNPKVIPVQVFLFFSLAVLTQVGWLVLESRQRFIFALLLVLLSTGCSIISLAESYRSLAAVQPMLHQEERSLDLWAVRIFLQNALALFMTWITLNGTLTFAYLLTFSTELPMTAQKTASLVQLCLAGFLVFTYVLSDLTVFDKYSRYVWTPYLGFVFFHAAQMNKVWPSLQSEDFVLLAGLMAFAFLCVLIKVIVFLVRYVQQLNQENKPTIVSLRPLPSDTEEETYLLNH